MLNIIGTERPKSGLSIEEPRVSETRFVNGIGRKDARVRTEVLLITDAGLGAADVNGLLGLRFNTPTIAAGPLRFGGFDEIHTQNKAVTA